VAGPIQAICPIHTATRLLRCIVGGATIHASSNTSASSSRSATLATVLDVVVRGVGSTVPRRLLQHHGAHSPTPATDWVADSGASNHTTPYSGSISSPLLSSAFQPHSIIVGNGSILPVTLVGDSVLPRLFYLNDVLVVPDLVQSLLFVRRFTTDNSCSMEFDPFGLYVKDLATRSVITRYDSSGPCTPSRFLRRSPSPQMLHRTPWQPRLRPPPGTATLVILAPTSSPSCRAAQ
jgi:hypothetical protein